MLKKLAAGKGSNRRAYHRRFPPTVKRGRRGLCVIGEGLKVEMEK